MVGKIVRHSRFGKGVILEYSAPYLKVRFEDSGVEKRFSYPLACESFLCFEDGGLQTKAEEAIAAIRAEEAQKAQAQALAIRQKEQALVEAHRAEVKARRAAAAKKASATRTAGRKAAVKV